MNLYNLFNETIRKEGDKYVVRSKKGKSMGKYDSKSAAEERLRQVEMFKHMAESIKLSEAERDIQVEVPGIGVYTADTLSSNIIQSIDKLHRAAEAGDWEQVEYSLDPSKMGATLLTKAQALVQALKQNRMLEADNVIDVDFGQKKKIDTKTTEPAKVTEPEVIKPKKIVEPPVSTTKPLSNVNDIAKLNNIADINKIQAGAEITMPDGSKYKIKPGDNLTNITKNYNAQAGAQNIGKTVKTTDPVKTTEPVKTKEPQVQRRRSAGGVTLTQLQGGGGSGGGTGGGGSGGSRGGGGSGGGSFNFSDNLNANDRNIVNSVFDSKGARGALNVLGRLGAGTFVQGVPDAISTLSSGQFKNLTADAQAKVFNDIYMGAVGLAGAIGPEKLKMGGKVWDQVGLGQKVNGVKLGRGIVGKLPAAMAVDQGLKAVQDWRNGDYEKVARRIATGVAYGFIPHPAVFFTVMALLDPDFDDVRKEVAGQVGQYYNDMTKDAQDQGFYVNPAFESKQFEEWTDNVMTEMLGEAGKDACYHKVKSRYKVWPSAYASGALVKCRKVGAKNWGNKSKKKSNENVEMDSKLDVNKLLTSLRNSKKTPNSDRLADAIEMRFMHNMTFKDIGKELNVAPQTAAIIVSKALRLLRWHAARNPN